MNTAVSESRNKMVASDRVASRHQFSSTAKINILWRGSCVRSHSPQLQWFSFSYVFYFSWGARRQQQALGEKQQYSAALTLFTTAC